MAIRSGSLRTRTRRKDTVTRFLTIVKGRPKAVMDSQRLYKFEDCTVFTSLVTRPFYDLIHKIKVSKISHGITKLTCSFHLDLHHPPTVSKHEKWRREERTSLLKYHNRVQFFLNQLINNRRHFYGSRPSIEFLQSSSVAIVRNTGMHSGLKKRIVSMSDLPSLKEKEKPRMQSLDLAISHDTRSTSPDSHSLMTPKPPLRTSSKRYKTDGHLMTVSPSPDEQMEREVGPKEPAKVEAPLRSLSVPGGKKSSKDRLREQPIKFRMCSLLHIVFAVSLIMVLTYDFLTILFL